MQVFDDRFQAESGWNCLFCYKTLHVSDIFSAHHREFSTIHLALVSFMQVLTMIKTFMKLTSDDFKTCTKLTSAECTVENS